MHDQSFHHIRHSFIDSRHPFQPDPLEEAALHLDIDRHFTLPGPTSNLPLLLLAAFLALSLDKRRLIQPVHGAPASDGGSTVTPSSSYIVYLRSAPPILNYRGGIKGYAATAPDVADSSLLTTSSIGDALGDIGHSFNDAVNGAMSDIRQRFRPLRADIRASGVQAFQKFLGKLQQDIAASVNISSKKIFRSYTYAVNAFGARLNQDQVEALESHPDVAMVRPDRIVHLRTSHTPTFLKLSTTLWSANGGVRNAGEGVIIGVIDSGIWPEHPSFADDTYGPVPARWRGTCVKSADFKACNKKVIGARFYNAGISQAGVAIDYATDFKSPRDGNGHGSWCSGAAAGNNGVNVKMGPSSFGIASGMAPRARIAMYKTMWRLAGTDGASGAMSDVYAAVDQAIADGVDVLSLSVGGGLTSYFDDLSFISAVQAGVFATLAAGNQGPPPADLFNYATIDNYSPFYLTVGASSTDRRYMANMTLGNGMVLQGPSWGGSNKMLQIVDGGQAVRPFASSSRAKLCYSNAIMANKVSGKILLCVRGENFLTDKLSAAVTAGAAAVIISNVAKGLSNTVFLRSAIPVIHITAAQATQLQRYLSNMRTQGRVPTARISSPYAVDNDMAPVIADFSSRGPVVNPAMQASWAGTNDILKPDVVGPGVNLWGPWRTPSLAQASTPNFGMVSGTSMATPHLAGLAALVVQKNPTWSPAQIISAFMTTASTTTNRGGLIPTDTGSVATPWDMGQGQVNTSGLLNPGLTYDASYTDFVNFLAGQSTWRANNIFSSMQLTPVPAYNLNRASISVSRMKKFVTINRRVTSVWTRASTYRAVLVVPDNVGIDLEPRTFTIAPGASVKYQMNITVRKASAAFSYGSLTWVDNNGHVVRSVIAVQPLTA
ncbi:unnamed protein product [Closterium sp. Naga37s-1]|nr:unnamed protein product [Closterium sp. Naga37s-1]